jgi:flagellar biosynthesis protein
MSMAIGSQALDVEKLAIALAYERGVDVAPSVVAKGKGYIAKQIIALARENGVEIREDADLAALLSRVEIGETIPVEAYMAVAEILSYIYRANQRLKEGKTQ